LCRHYFTIGNEQWAMGNAHGRSPLAVRAFGIDLALADRVQAPARSALDSLRFRGATAEFFSADA
jgi:hypothetical protein